MTKRQKFSDTVQWAYEEDKIRNERTEGISITYLIIAAIIILLFMILLIYLMSSISSDHEISSLDMMKDEQYIYGTDGEYEYGTEEEYEDGPEGEYEGD